MRWFAGLVLVAACGRGFFNPMPPPVDGQQTDVRPIDAPPDSSLNSGLLLHYSFDMTNTYIDSTGNSDATCVAAMCPMHIAGRIGDGALSLTGTECITAADKPNLRPVAFTFAIWMNTPTMQTATLFSRPFMGATAMTDTFEIHVAVNDLFFAVGPGTVTASQPVGWHHVAGTFDGTTLHGYVDGVEVGTPVAGSAGYAADAFMIGCDVDNGSYVSRFIGSLDDPRLYDRVLSPGELAELAAM